MASLAQIDKTKVSRMILFFIRSSSMRHAPPFFPFSESGQSTESGRALSSLSVSVLLPVLPLFAVRGLKFSFQRLHALLNIGFASYSSFFSFRTSLPFFSLRCQIFSPFFSTTKSVFFRESTPFPSKYTRVFRLSFA